MIAALLTLASPSITVADVTKVSQITGETDRQRNRPTDNQTETRYGLKGTDLGASFEHRGKLVFLFGDTWPVGPNTPDRPVDGDSVAFSSDTNPDDGLTLNFVTASDGKYLATHIPGTALAGFEAPNGGFSDGKHMYAYYTTDHSFEPRGVVMGRSVLARTDDAKSWGKIYDFSSDKFINISPQVVDASKEPGLPITKGKALLLWASSKEYRRSSPYLACVPLGQVEDRTAIRFWAGVGKWSRDEFDAKPVLDHIQIGEISVTWCEPLKLWLMLYNSGQPRGIQIRTARYAVGPWSDNATLFDPKDGYGKFMHISWKDRKVDSVNDPGRENEYGGEYAPYMIPRFFRKNEKGARIYFVMSTWNPYNVVLMRADLRQ
ncbi:hypothetical protein BH11ARM2_BH11ARM2_05930 [soil metagenome]